MVPYGVRTTVLLPSAASVSALFSLVHSNDVLLYVIQTDLVCLLRNEEIIGQLAIRVTKPMCIVRNDLVATSTAESTMLKFTHNINKGLQGKQSDFKEKVNCLSAFGEELFSSSGARVHRHSGHGSHQLLRTFSDPVRALASVSEERLLVLLANTLHLMNPLTNQDLLEVACDVSNPIEIIWTASLQHKIWFVSLVRPEPMSSTRQYRLFMTELDEIATSKDITPDGIDHNRSLLCRMKGNKLVSLAENGNAILVSAVEDFGERSLLYRAEATDIPFTAVDIIKESKGAHPPTLAVATSNGAVAFFSKLDDP